jgi:ribonuclease HI
MSGRVSGLSIYTDGGSRGNPGPAAIALLIYGGGRLLASHSEYIGEATNNVAEYRAVLKALRMAARLFKPSSVVCTLDSQLVASQLAGKYKIKNLHLRELNEMVKREERKLGKVSYRSVKREDPRISLADGMLNRMLDRVRRRGV